MYHLNILNTESPGTCGPCGGQCCKSLPGTTHPDEWGRVPAEILRNITKALRSGRWSVDWWEGDPRDRDERSTVIEEWKIHRLGELLIFRKEPKDPEDFIGKTMYLRPRRKGARVEDPAWGWDKVPCTFLTPNGCELEHDKRPSECRALVPSPKGSEHCSSEGTYGTFSKKTNSVAWLPFQNLIYEALDRMDMEEAAE